jgi:hypothetical protein
LRLPLNKVNPDGPEMEIIAGFSVFQSSMEQQGSSWINISENQSEILLRIW